MGGGKSPDNSEIENLKNEIAKINKQLQAVYYILNNILGRG